MIIKILESLDELSPKQEKLFTAAGKRSVFLTLPWFRNLISTVFTTGQIRLYLAESTAGMPQAALLCHTKERTSIFNRRSLTGLVNYYSSFYGPIVNYDDPSSSQAIKALIDEVCQERERWDALDFHPLAIDRQFHDIQDAIKATHYILEPYFCFGNWHLPVNGRNYKEYEESLPSKLRNTIKRKTKKLSKEYGFRVELVDEPESAAAAIPQFVAIYNRSWKKPEPYPQFIPGLIKTCADEGWLRLGMLYVDNIPAAAQLWITHNGIANIFKLAYDNQFAKYSVGSILTQHLMKHAIDIDKVTEVDYLTGDDAYKQEWMSDRRERWGIAAYNARSVLGQLALTRNVRLKKLKYAMQQSKRLNSNA